MELLEKRIAQDGEVYPGNILKAQQLFKPSDGYQSAERDGQRVETIICRCRDQ